MMRAGSPSIDEIAANPALAADLSSAQRQLIVHRCAALILLVSGGPESGDTSAPIVDDGRLLTTKEATRPQSENSKEDRLLTAAELAALMNVSLSWVRHDGNKLPFAVRLPGRKVVHGYSYTGYLRWLRTRDGR